MDISSLGIHGAYRRVDVLAAIGERRLRTAITTGELSPMWTGVVVEPRRRLDPLTRGSAALLLADEDAALSGATAAVLHGCASLESAAVHITVRPGRRLKPRPGLVVHSCGYFTDDIVDVRGLAVLALDRVVSDLLCSSRPQDGLALADEVLRMAGDGAEATRKLIGSQLRRRVDPRGTVRGAHLLDLASPRAASPPESWLRWHLIDAGFPIPEVNWKVRAIDGTVVYVVDLAWPSLRIAVEYDGYAAHVDRQVEDLAREADLRRRGWIVIRWAAADLGSPARVERELRSAFARRGYTW